MCMCPLPFNITRRINDILFAIWLSFIFQEMAYPINRIILMHLTLRIVTFAFRHLWFLLADCFLALLILCFKIKISVFFVNENVLPHPNTQFEFTQQPITVKHAPAFACGRCWLVVRLIKATSFQFSPILVYYLYSNENINKISLLIKFLS